MRIKQAKAENSISINVGSKFPVLTKEHPPAPEEEVEVELALEPEGVGLVAGSGVLLVSGGGSVAGNGMALNLLSR